jgi:hypothetical protein
MSWDIRAKPQGYHDELFRCLKWLSGCYASVCQLTVHPWPLCFVNSRRHPSVPVDWTTIFIRTPLEIQRWSASRTFPSEVPLHHAGSVEFHADSVPAAIFSPRLLVVSSYRCIIQGSRVCRRTTSPLDGCYSCAGKVCGLSRSLEADIARTIFSGGNGNVSDGAIRTYDCRQSRDYQSAQRMVLRSLTYDFSIGREWLYHGITVGSSVVAERCWTIYGCCSMLSSLYAAVSVCCVQVWRLLK